MAVSPFDSVLMGPLLGDEPIAGLFADRAEIAAMIAVEAALAQAEAACGVIPAAMGPRLAEALDSLTIAPAEIAEATAAAGVAAGALAAALRRRLPPDLAPWVHWGATSQDIADTALVLRLDTALTLMAERLANLIATLRAAEARWATLPMAARTRTQIAAPTTVGQRIGCWAAPLSAAADERPLLRRRVARVQFGGAVGTLDVLGEAGPAVRAALAERLGLHDAPCWHGDRSGLVALASWCAQLAGALGKMGTDLLLMARSESGEMRAGAGGGSSTMPQKANPVASEVLVALSRFVAGLVSPLMLAAQHAEERDGVAWTMEWLLLPQIVTATGAALRVADELARTLRPDESRLAAMLALGGGAAYAERASFALRRLMPGDRAQAVLTAALAEAARGGSLAEALAREVPGEDWPAHLGISAGSAAEKP